MPLVIGLVGAFIGALLRPFFDNLFVSRREEKKKREELLTKHNKYIVDTILKDWFGYVQSGFFKRREEIRGEISSIDMSHNIRIQSSITYMPLSLSEPICAVYYKSRGRSMKSELADPNLEHVDQAIEHLKNGYPDIWKLWDEAKIETDNYFDNVMKVWKNIEDTVFDNITKECKTLVEYVKQGPPPEGGR